MGPAKGTFSFSNDRRKKSLGKYILFKKDCRQHEDTRHQVRSQSATFSSQMLKINLSLDYYLQNKTK